MLNVSSVHAGTPSLVFSGGILYILRASCRRFSYNNGVGKGEREREREGEGEEDMYFESDTCSTLAI
jgi:hypothetical protein